MATGRARVFSYGVSLDADWTATSDRGGSALPHESGAWTPEHLLLAGLARCSLTALRFHAKRAGISVAAEAEASGTVTRRESDGRFAFVEIDVAARVTTDTPVDDDTLRGLLARAERDCFVGASLTVAPRYTWTVNGTVVV
jgi:organic hydroperoxide reductase OsmC/OhrA